MIAKNASRTKEGYLLKNRILKIALIVALLCFLLPYVMVSCDGQDMGTYSGVELATGHTFDDDSEIDDDDYSANIFVIAAFIAGAVALVIVFVRKSGGASVAICSTVAIIALILFRATFISYYGLEDDKDYIEIELRWGFFATIICYITSIVTALIPEKTPQWYDPGIFTDKGTAPFAGINSQPQVDANKFCEQCGMELTSDTAFCVQCGAPQEPSDACANCGYKFENSDGFCPKCGTKKEG